MEGKENIRVEVRDRGARQEEEKAAFVTKIKTEHVNLYYGERQVLKDITFDMGENKVTAFIGPSGCGKSSYLRCLNRMNDFISSARVEGTINIDGENILAPSTDVIGLRRKVGMVFQKPNPFPMSIYDNIAYGPRLNGIKDKDKLDEIVEKSLEGAALWDEVKDKLKTPGTGLSGAPLHRARDGDAAGHPADGRADLRARPDVHAEDRRARQRAQKGLHGRHSHAQHAAGGAHLGLHGLLSAGRFDRI